MASKGVLDRQDLLRKKTADLSKAVQLSPPFWDNLKSHGVITQDKIEQIQKGGVAIEQSQTQDLIEHLLEGTDKQYQGFIEALMETGQQAVVSTILQEQLPQQHEEGPPKMTTSEEEDSEDEIPLCLQIFHPEMEQQESVSTVVVPGTSRKDDGQTVEVPGIILEYPSVIVSGQDSCCNHQRSAKEHQAADLFFHETGGVLQLPGSDVVLRIPPKAVPAGKVYAVHGKIHTNVKEYNQWMASDDEFIISPVVEYTIEGGEMFDQPVEINIPHCLHPSLIQNINVLCGGGEEYRVLQKNDSDITYSVEPHCLRIQTRHFTKFMATATGQKGEITDLLLTVAAKQMETEANSVTCLRVMLHTGLTMMNDFATIRKMNYDKGMEEIVTDKMVLRESKKRIPLPDVHVTLNVTDSCDAVIRDGRTPRKQTSIQVDGEDVLKFPNQNQNRSEKLANFTLDHSLRSQLNCSLEVTFKYKKGIEPVVETIPIIYPDKSASGQVASSQKREDTDDALTYKEVEDIIKNNRPTILKRLVLSPLLQAELVAAKVLSTADTDELNSEGTTNHEKIDRILNTIVQKGAKTFLDFCLVLDKGDTQQSHVVTEVMGLSMDYIRSQRELHTDGASTSATTGSPPGEDHPGWIMRVRRPEKSATVSADAPSKKGSWKGK